MDKETNQTATNPYDTISDKMGEHNTDTAVTNTQPNVSPGDLYTKPNKPKKNGNNAQDSQNASDYACVYGHVTGDLDENGTKGSGNEELDYIEIDHRGTGEATRDVGPQPQSETVTYAEVQPKTTTADTTPQVGDTDVSMVENDLYT